MVPAPAVLAFLAAAVTRASVVMVCSLRSTSRLGSKSASLAREVLASPGQAMILYASRVAQVALLPVQAAEASAAFAVLGDFLTAMDCWAAATALQAQVPQGTQQTAPFAERGCGLVQAAGTAQIALLVVRRR
mmetsp:Transcript_59271/g.95873  ORF Transcript_59271/g.95873 Transcript_59271/m.95873 type:complete len:133 (+) Transcript_59271:345-743(+)